MNSGSIIVTLHKSSSWYDLVNAPPIPVTVASVTYQDLLSSCCLPTYKVL